MYCNPRMALTLDRSPLGRWTFWLDVWCAPGRRLARLAFGFQYGLCRDRHSPQHTRGLPSWCHRLYSRRTYLLLFLYKDFYSIPEMLSPLHLTHQKSTNQCWVRGPSDRWASYSGGTKWKHFGRSPDPGFLWQGTSAWPSAVYYVHPPDWLLQSLGGGNPAQRALRQVPTRLAPPLRVRKLSDVHTCWDGLAPPRSAHLSDCNTRNMMDSNMPLPTGHLQCLGYCVFTPKALRYLHYNSISLVRLCDSGLV